METGRSVPVGLTINQRNIYMYFLNHIRKYKNAPCFVPKISATRNRTKDYFRALDALEEKQLIVIDRSSPNYTGWIMKEPK